MINLKKILFVLPILALFVDANAQLKYTSDGRLTIGDTTPYKFYLMTINGTGAWFNCKNNNFFQIDVTPSSPRIAGTENKIVFYNSQNNVYNSILVKNVYNQSDERAKTNIKNLTNGLNTVLKLRPVSYNFVDDYQKSASKLGENNYEIGLLAQDVEKVLPNVVTTDDNGYKLINYNAMIPILIDAIKTLQAEVEELKNRK